MDHFVLGGLVGSVILNAFLAFKIYRKDNVLTVDAKRLLAELSRGKAIIEVKVMDASGLFYRSPRG